MSIAVSAFDRPNSSPALRGLRFCQFHLTEDRADDQHLRIAADLAADVFPAPALLALDVEQLLGEVFAFHVRISLR
ncbi:hypothetical protein ACVWYI_005831 [Bradyrhizobium sp. LB13.1]